MSAQEGSVQREMSFGEKAVGLHFNPSDMTEVAKIKKEFADIIDRLNYARGRATSNEVKRMLSVAITEAQTAQMWAVKAVTWQFD